mgnify:FL=1
MNKNIDIMSLSHFLIYFILGIFIKNNYKLVILLSILWEITEYIITNNDYTKELLLKYWPIPQRLWDEQKYNRIYDLIFNMMGYYIGNKIYLKK